MDDIDCVEDNLRVSLSLVPILHLRDRNLYPVLSNPIPYIPNLLCEVPWT